VKPYQQRFFHWIALTYFWLTERLYHELAWFYDLASWIVSLGQWDAWRKCSLEFLVGVDLLEIGFGTGELLLEMARRNLHAVGLESSTAMQRIARRKLHSQGFDVPRVQGVIQQTPFADDSFDTIISTFPAGFIFNPETWREVARLLRKNDSASFPISSRFIVVGLSIIQTGKLRLLGVAPLFQLSYDEGLHRIRQQAKSVDLDIRIEIRSFPGFDLPIIVAEESK
jgi:ubiquinone/menaquinone biosynthesis C-methylase UbiE